MSDGPSRTHTTNQARPDATMGSERRGLTAAARAIYKRHATKKRRQRDRKLAR